LNGLQTLDEPGADEWQTLAVNAVPAPGVLPLLGLGLAGRFVGKRRTPRVTS